MKRPVLHTIILAAVVVLAGCAGGFSASPTSDATPDESARTATTDAGTVAFYISDQANAIGDFQQLEVTVTRVGIERAADEGGGWVEREVDDVTVDLTGLRGANATLVDEYDVPNGTYDKVFVHVDAVNATLENGEQVRVKLPSEKLQIKQEFTVGDDTQVDFVFDIAVHKAGNSGKYILKPVVSESGTDVPIERTDDEPENEGEDDDREDDDDRDDDDRENELNATVVGDVTPGENATLEVTLNGDPVSNATVRVDGVVVGTTAADGRVTVAVPRDDELEVKISNGESDAELEFEFDEEDSTSEARSPNALERVDRP